MKTRNILIAVFIGVLFGSCYTQRPLERTAPYNNRTYQIEYLFEHEGCKVYRFEDYGQYVYFTNCTGNVSRKESDSTDVRITTLIRAE